MSDVVDLAEYAGRRLHIAERPSTGENVLQQPQTHSAVPEASISLKIAGGEFIPAIRLYGDLDVEISRFFALTGEAIELLTNCDELLRSGERLAADDLFMACKPLFEEIFILRDISDAIGLITLKCVQASNVLAISDAPELPLIMRRAVTRIRSAPYLDFPQASTLADEIEKATGAQICLPGYTEIAKTLIADEEIER